MQRIIDYAVPSASGKSTTQLLHLRLREHHERGGRMIVNSRGPGSLLFKNIYIYIFCKNKVTGRIDRKKMRNKMPAGRREDGQQTMSLQLEKGLNGQCVSVSLGLLWNHLILGSGDKQLALSLGFYSMLCSLVKFI